MTQDIDTTEINHDVTPVDSPVDEVQELRKLIIALTTEIEQKEHELFAIQVALAGQVDA